jgi:glutamine amidotransferase
MTMVAIVDSGGANIASLQYALERLGACSMLTSDPRELRSAERVILPGVGSAADAMSRLRNLDLEDTLRGLEQPVLGICLGMQLLFGSSEEGAAGRDTRCLGMVEGRVTRIERRDGLPVPHMGWNRVRVLSESALLAGVADGAHMYFVHSYAAPVGPWTVAATRYGDDFTAALSVRNLHGTQFHPERSAGAGQRVLQNFLGLR